VDRTRIAQYFGLAFVVLIVAGSLAGILIERGMRLDFANFYDAGQKALAGQFSVLYDPFAEILGELPLGNMTFFSLPLTSFLYTPFARFEPQTALILFKIQSTIFTWAGLLILFFHLRKFSGTGQQEQAMYFALFAGAALLFQPFWTVYRVGGQTTPLIFMLLVVGLVSYTDRRYWLTAACYVLVILIKPIFVPGLLLLFIFSGAKFRVASVMLSALVAVVSIWLLGWGVHTLFLETLSAQGAKFVTPFYNSNMFTWVEMLLVRNTDYAALTSIPGGVRLVSLLLRLVTIAFLLVMLIKLRRSDAPPIAKRHFCFVVSMLVPMILSPVVWSHYLTVFFVPLAYIIAFRRQFADLALAALGGAVAFSVFQNLIIVVKIGKLVGLDTWGEVFLMTAVKSLTMLLIVAVILIWGKQYLATYRNAAWAVQ